MFRNRRLSAIEAFLKIKKRIYLCQKILIYLELNKIMAKLKTVANKVSKRNMRHRQIIFIKTRGTQYWKHKVLKRNRDVHRIHRNHIVNNFTFYSLVILSKAYKALDFFLDINA